eukprot:1728166-Pleurochrysis_carterae.AAC.1
MQHCAARRRLRLRAPPPAPRSCRGGRPLPAPLAPCPPGLGRMPPRGVLPRRACRSRAGVRPRTGPSCSCVPASCICAPAPPARTARTLRCRLLQPPTRRARAVATTAERGRPYVATTPAPPHRRSPR